jgi:hypothetical protein
MESFDCLIIGGGPARKQPREGIGVLPPVAPGADPKSRQEVGLARLLSLFRTSVPNCVRPKRECQFLPAESPLLMSSQQLRAFRRTELGARTPGHMRLRRAFIFISPVALTSAGCYEIYEVVQVGGVTILEWMVLVCS